MDYFRRTYPLADRIDLAQKIKVEYPDRVPIVLQYRDADSPYKWKKVLAPPNITYNLWINEITRAYNNYYGYQFESENGDAFPLGFDIITIYNNFKSDDGFLYIFAR
jgi:hypothetical protein